MAGSVQRRWSSARKSCPPADISASAISDDSVMPNAAAIRTSNSAVGLASSRSILESIAFDTPECSASSASDQPRLARSVRTRSPILSGLSIICDMRPL